MYKFLFTAAIYLIAFNGKGQQLSQANFNYGGQLNWLSYSSDNDLQIRISVDGKVLEYGVELKSFRYDFYAPKLQPYMGKIEFYGNDVDSMFRGKLKSVGVCTFTYYASYETDGKPGKLKSIGRVMFDYYNQYDDKMLQGKIKFAGSSQFQYHNSFNDENNRGKIKAIGATPITYYGMFDDKMLRGKLKSIGSINYTWYSSTDRSDLRGALKSPSYRMNINGITFIVGF